MSHSGAATNKIELQRREKREESKDKGTANAVSNLRNVGVRSALDLNVYEVVNAKNMLISKNSIKEVEERLS